MNDLFERLLDRRWTLAGACGTTLAIGLVFIFVRAPHPWGREGFDHYHDLALTVAAGRPFPTMEVPWGYAYFLAAFYRTFGDRPWLPLTVQAVMNAAMPLLVFVYARTWLDRRTAIRGLGKLPVVLLIENLHLAGGRLERRSRLEPRQSL